MAKQCNFNEKYVFICKQIDTYKDTLENTEVMQSCLGNVIKDVIKNNYIFNDVFNHENDKKRMLSLLRLKYSENTISLIMKNLEIEK